MARKRMYSVIYGSKYQWLIGKKFDEFEVIGFNKDLKSIVLRRDDGLFDVMPVKTAVLKLKRLKVTKHAELRYIQRVKDILPGKAYTIIREIVESKIKGAVNASVVHEGCLFIVRDNKVITVINHE